MEKEFVIKVNNEVISEKEFKHLLKSIKANDKIDSKMQEEQFLEGLISVEILSQYAKSNNLHKEEEFNIAMKYFEKEMLAKIVIQNELQRIVSSGETKVSEKEIDEYLEKNSDIKDNLRKVLSENMKNMNEDEKNIYLSEETRKYIRNLLEKLKLGLKQAEFIKNIRDKAKIEYI